MYQQVEILSADENLIAANKPYGLPTTFKNTEDTSDCLIKQVAAKYPDVLKVDGFKPNEGGLIYRLDNDTSGVVLVARTQQKFDELVAAQKADRMMKFYYAICEDTGFNEKHWQADSDANSDIASHKTKSPATYSADCPDFKSFGFHLESVLPEKPQLPDLSVSYPIGHSKKSSKRMVVVMGKNFKTQGAARPVTTYFRILERRGKLTFVEVMIFKGMRHQIRAHLASIGLKIIGDPLYNSTSKVKANIQRLFLHCGKIVVL